MTNLSRVILVLSEARDKVPFSQTFSLTWEEANEVLFSWSLHLPERDQPYQIDVKVEYRDRSTLITKFPLPSKIAAAPDLESHCALDILDGCGRYRDKK